MPFFKSTYNIFKTPHEDEVFNHNWMDSGEIILPPTVDWDYGREMTIEDVDIWEEIYYESTGAGLYAAWCPYAEFYMITGHDLIRNPGRVELYYGPNAMKRAYARAKQFGWPITPTKTWVEDSEMWLHVDPPPEDRKIISTPSIITP